MATALTDVCAVFIGMAGTLYLSGYDGLAFVLGWTALLPGSPAAGTLLRKFGNLPFLTF